jgi:Rrf2 family iron-sulfur cluster assembly transcriptional regulator
MVDYLDSVSLQDLVDQQKQKNAEQSVVVLATATTPPCKP